jgi:hypothetical protein
MQSLTVTVTVTATVARLVLLQVTLRDLNVRLLGTRVLLQVELLG